MLGAVAAGVTVADLIAAMTTRRRRVAEARLVRIKRLWELGDGAPILLTLLPRPRPRAANVYITPAQAARDRARYRRGVATRN